MIEFLVVSALALGVIFFIASHANSGLARQTQTRPKSEETGRGARADFYQRLYAELNRNRKKEIDMPEC
jgi:hypothetical protein